MVRPVLASLSLALLLPGCGHRHPPPLPADAEQIVWEDESPFMCGRCDSLKLTVRSDGTMVVERGHWVGRQELWRTTLRYRKITPEEFNRFRDHLAAVRPQGYRSVGDDNCGGPYFTDQGGFVVTWRGTRVDRLQFDNGCDHQATTRNALAMAPKVLGIDWP